MVVCDSTVIVLPVIWMSVIQKLKLYCAPLGQRQRRRETTNITDWWWHLFRHCRCFCQHCLKITVKKLPINFVLYWRMLSSGNLGNTVSEWYAGTRINSVVVYSVFPKTYVLCCSHYYLATPRQCCYRWSSVVCLYVCAGHSHEPCRNWSTLCLRKKQDTKLLPITSPNVNRFSKFFHW